MLEEHAFTIDLMAKDSGDRTYTYAIITTSSNQQLRFLHHRMPVIFDANSEDFRQWLHPLQRQWTNDLQSSLKPYSGELEIYPVDRKVGKVGCSSPSFILPLSDKDNGHDIKHFFTSDSQNSGIKLEESGEIDKHESRDNRHIKNAGAESSLLKRPELNRKRKADSSYSSPSKKKTGPPGVKKITDFFN